MPIKAKRKKNQSNESLCANKTHIDSQCICLLYKMLKLGLPLVMEADTVYEHFGGNKFTGKKFLWARFIMQEQELIPISNNKISFYGQRSTHSKPGHFSQMAVQHLKGAFKITRVFFLSLNNVKFRFFPLT